MRLALPLALLICGTFLVSLPALMNMMGSLSLMLINQSFNAQIFAKHAMSGWYQAGCITLGSLMIAMTIYLSKDLYRSPAASQS